MIFLINLFKLLVSLYFWLSPWFNRVAKMIEEVDVSKDGQIEWHEFLAAMVSEGEAVIAEECRLAKAEEERKRAGEYNLENLVLSNLYTHAGRGRGCVVYPHLVMPHGQHYNKSKTSPLKFLSFPMFVFQL